MSRHHIPTLHELLASSKAAEDGLAFVRGETADVVFSPVASLYAADERFVARCATGENWIRNASFIAGCVNYVRSVTLPDFVSGRIARRKPAILFDVEAARHGEWCWYVTDEPDDDGLFDERSIERQGERRIYFESMPAILAELNIDEPINLRDVLARDIVDSASEDEVRVARELYASDEIQIDNAPTVSHADKGSWVAAWVWISDAEIAGEKTPMPDATS